MMQVKLTPTSHDYYELLENFKWDVGYECGVVPKGFLTNGANLPRFVRWIWDCYSPSFISPVVVHDYLYGIAEMDEDTKFKEYERADRIFYLLLKQYGRSELTAKSFFLALRVYNSVLESYVNAYTRACRLFQKIKGN